MDANWRRLTEDSSDEEIMLYYNVGASFFYDDNYYLGMDPDWLRRKMKARGDECDHWIYEEKDSDRKAVMGFQYTSTKINPFTTVQGMWKLSDVCYAGTWGNMDRDGFSWDALRFVVKAVRTRMAEKNIEHIFAHLNGEEREKKYVTKYFEALEKVVWEIVEKCTRPDGYHYLLHMNRSRKDFPKPVDEDTWIDNVRVVPTRPDSQLGTI